MARESTAKRILVVEDDASIRNLLVRLIAAEGFLVDQASDGNEALAKARQAAPDLVFMDVRLPGMDGYQVTQALKRELGLVELPVIFLSGQSPAEDGGRSFASGGLLYLRKPIHKNQLQHVLELVLGSAGKAPTARKENRPHRR